MKNALAKLSSRPRFSAIHSKGVRVFAVLNTAIIAAAVALPLLALSPEARADEARVPVSGTFREMITRGSVLIVNGMDIDVAYTNDGKFTAMNGQVQGKWRIDGETLCTSTNFQPVETCALYPRDKKSGDTFEIMTDQGQVQIRIK
jgi:hypothetical protein